MRKTSFLLTLVVVTFLSIAGDSYAQRGGRGGGWGGGGYGGYRGGWGGGYGGWGGGYYGRSYAPYYGSYYGSGYSPYYYYSSPGYYVDPNLTYSYPSTATQSYYFGPGTAAQPINITVLVPNPDAEVWFENSPTRQRGMSRQFQSPPADAGFTYTYTIKARWMQNGQPVEREQQVSARAGENVTADFRAASGEQVPLPTAPPRNQ